MKLTFIVNGTETIVTARPTMKLENAAKLALKQTGNDGRHFSEFQALLGDQSLSFNHSINNQKVTVRHIGRTKETIEVLETSVIFLSLRAGQGA